MKSLFFILIVLSTNAFAAKVGDRAVFRVTVSSGLVDKETRELVAYNAERDTFTKRWTYESQTYAQPMVTEMDLPRSLLESKECTTELETLEVPAGSFQACKVVDDSIVEYTGNVPMGDIKMEYKGASFSSTYELIEYSEGK